MMGRIKCESWLVQNGSGDYTFDFDDLENHFRSGAKVLMLCTPHHFRLAVAMPKSILEPALALFRKELKQFKR